MNALAPTSRPAPRDLARGLMLASAWIASTLVGNFQRHVARWSGPVVLVCGLLMLQRGFALASPAGAAAAKSDSSAAALAIAPQIVRMTAGAHGWSPDHFVLRKNVPVKWIVDGRDASACTARRRVPWLDRDIELKAGETVVEFTPPQAGEISWSCWMGMARGSFTVVEPASPRSTRP